MTQGQVWSCYMRWNSFLYDFQSSYLMTMIHNVNTDFINHIIGAKMELFAELIWATFPSDKTIITANSLAEDNATDTVILVDNFIIRH